MPVVVLRPWKENEWIVGMTAVKAFFLWLLLHSHSPLPL